MNFISKVRSRAKINLFLHINEKLPNGYHELESLFYFPEIFDEIDIYESDTTSLEVKGKFKDVLRPFTNDNLIIKAHNTLQKIYPSKVLEHLYVLKKKIPVSAGLGGGSGNAASVLNFLNQHYDLKIDNENLINIAKELGADVPPSLFEKPCLVSGIGDKINFDIVLPELFILVINPSISVSTKQIFEMGIIDYKEKMNDVQFSFKSLDEFVGFLDSSTDNSLYDNALNICPEIGSLLNQLKCLEGSLLARMSGSGASVFSIFDSIENLNKAYRKMKFSHPEYIIMK